MPASNNMALSDALALLTQEPARGAASMILGRLSRKSRRTALHEFQKRGWMAGVELGT